MQINHINSSKELEAETPKQSPKHFLDKNEGKQDLTQINWMIANSNKLRKDNTYYEELAQDWRSRLSCDYPQLSSHKQESIICWLIGNSLEFETFNSFQLKAAHKSMEYRYQILRQYLEQNPKQAYEKLIARLSRLGKLRHKIRSLVEFSRDRDRSVADVL